MMHETRKILGDRVDRRQRDLRARARSSHGHSESVNVQTRDAAVARARRASCCAAAPGVTVARRPGAGRYPMALDAAGRDDVLRRPHPPRPVARARR